MLKLIFLSLAFIPLPALASDLNGADTAWILTASALVLMMTLPGLALFYAGLVRSKNVLSVLAQCFSIAAVASILWFLLGYSLAFSEGNAFIGDFSKAFMLGIGRDALSGAIPESLFMLFQMTFAIITPALIIGSFAERMKFSAMLLFSSVWLLLVYAPIAHWLWGGGWLAQLGALDFAGGLVVHTAAGVSALVAALVIGNRNDFGKKPLPPHNLTMAVTGAGMLWVGWFGFNGGSALSAGGDASMAILVTHLAAASGVLAWTAYEWIKYGKPTVLGMITGMVAGLGAVTPASGFISPISAILIGLLAGLVCCNATNYLKQTLKIDDSLDVFPVHGVGGILGTILLGVLVSKDLGGVGSDIGMASQLKAQIIAAVAVVAYSAVVTWIILKVIGLLIGLRVSADQEQEGLDIRLHEEIGYDLH